MENSIKRAVITKGGDDDTNRPVQQIQYLERVSEAEIIFPYGVHANLPKDSLLTVFTILNNSSNKVAIGGLPDKRIQVEEGEVVFFHPLTKAKIHFRKNGDIDIDALDKNININCNDANIKVAGNANLDILGEFNVDVPTTNWTGDFVIVGDINQTGDLMQTGSITNDQTTSNGIVLDGHTHVGSPTAATGPVSDTGVSK